MEAGKPARRRRTPTEEFKQGVLAACREAGASVAGVELANGLNAKQVRRWMAERVQHGDGHGLAVRLQCNLRMRASSESPRGFACVARPW